LTPFSDCETVYAMTWETWSNRAHSVEWLSAPEAIDIHRLVPESCHPLET